MQETKTCKFLLENIMASSINKLMLSLGADESSTEFDIFSLTATPPESIDTISVSETTTENKSETVTANNGKNKDGEIEELESSESEQEEEEFEIPSLEDLIEAAADGFAGSLHRFLLVTRQLEYCKNLLADNFNIKETLSDEDEFKFCQRYPILAMEALQAFETRVSDDIGLLGNNEVDESGDESNILNNYSVQHIQFYRENVRCHKRTYPSHSYETSPISFCFPSSTTQRKRKTSHSLVDEPLAKLLKTHEE